MEATCPTALDKDFELLAERLPAWIETPVEKRIEYLREIRDHVHRLAESWVQVCCEIKGLDPKSQRAGEEWAMGPMIVLRNLRLMERQLTTPPREGGRIVRSLPEDSWDLFQWAIFKGETWSAPEFRQDFQVQGKVGLVLGAGNVSSISATDLIYKMFIENQVVLLKMNPVHEQLGPLLEEAFAPLIRDGFLRFAYGGADVGAAACKHPRVEALHVTGSHFTYEAIRASVGEDKPITAELGCISPVIVVPGLWSSRHLAYQARHVAGMLTTNGGFNCNAAQVLITSRQWPQREAFLNEVRRALSKVPARPAFYPGSVDRHKSLLTSYPQAEQLGPPGMDSIPWTLISGLSPDADERGFREEAFCGTLYEVALDVAYPDFLSSATAFANDRLWGNLSATILISPDSQRNLPWRRALEELRYGAIGVNIWAGMVFALVNLPWGAYPGNTPKDIQSGVDFVHNTANVANIEKAVLHAPFWSLLRMPWQSGFPRMRSFAKALTDFEYKPNWKALLRSYFELLRGGVGM